MKAFTKGTRSYRAVNSVADLLPNEAAFDGDVPVDADGMTPLLICDAVTGIVRPVTAADYAADAAALVTKLRTDAQAMVDAADANAKRWRALAIALMREFNRHSAKEKEILDALRTAVSLADLKVKATAILDFPTRAFPDIRAAVNTELSNGSAD